KWHPNAIAVRIEQLATEGSQEGTPAQMLEGFLGQLATQADTPFARNEPSTWCRDALQRMREWAGGTDNQPQGTQWHRSKLERLYMDTADKVAEEYALLINRPARRLFNTPGPR